VKLKNIAIVLLALGLVASAFGWQPGPWQQDHVYFDVYWEDFDLYIVSGSDTTKIDGGDITCVTVTTDTLSSGYVLVQVITQTDTITTYADPQVTFLEDVKMDSTVIITGNLTVHNKILADTLDTANDATLRIQENVLIDSTLTVTQNFTANNKALVDTLDTANDALMTFQEDAVFDSTVGVTGKTTLSDTLALNTKGIISSNQTQVEIVPDLTVTGGKITFGNAETVDNETNGQVAITADSTSLSGTLKVTATGIKLSGSDGSLTILGLGDGYDEDLALDLDNTENAVMVSSSTGVTKIDLGTIDLETDVADASTKVTTPEVEYAGNITLDPAVDGASYVNIANSGTGAAKLYVEGDQVNSDDLSDVASIAMLDEAETVTGAWTFGDDAIFDSTITLGADFLFNAATHNIGDLTNHVDTLFVSNIQPASILAILDSISVSGNIEGTTIGGITEANLLDKTATEEVSGAWTFTTKIIGQADSLDAYDSADFAVLAEDETVSGRYDFTDLTTISDTLLVNAPIESDGTNFAFGDSVTVTGNVSGTTIGGITEANLVDKTAAEELTGNWVNTTNPWADNEIEAFATGTKGDLHYSSATNTWTELGVGTDNQMLVVATDVPNWETASSDLLSDVASIAMLDEDESVTGSWTFGDDVVMDSTLNVTGRSRTTAGFTSAGIDSLARVYVSGNTNLGDATTDTTLFAGLAQHNEDVWIAGKDLWITGATGADSVRIYDDGTTTYLSTENIMNFSGTSLIYAISGAAQWQIIPAGLQPWGDVAETIGSPSKRVYHLYSKDVSIADSTTGDKDGWIYAMDDGVVAAHKFGWDDGLDTWYTDDDLTIAGKDLWITDATGADSVRIFDDGSQTIIKSDNRIDIKGEGGSGNLQLGSSYTNVQVLFKPVSNNSILCGRADARWSHMYTNIVAVGDSSTGDYDGWIYASDDGNITAHKFGWDDGLGVWMTDEILTASDLRMPIVAQGSPGEGSFYLGTADTLWVYSGAAWKYSVLSTP